MDTQTAVLPPHRAADLPRELIEQHPLRQKLRLAAEILAVYGRVRLSLFRTEFPVALERLRQTPSATPAAPVSPITYVRAARLGWAVRRTLRLVPTDSRCLMQSLVLTTLLARRGIESTLLIGVVPGDGFKAHAWVEYCQRALLPDAENEYQVLTRL